MCRVMSSGEMSSLCCYSACQGEIIWFLYTNVNLCQCPCGRESKRQKCGEPLLCEAPCGRELGCGRHRCEATCHLGECQPCAATLQQVCHCGGSTREVPCTLGAEEVFTCSSPCPRLQECGQHPCPSSCHPGPCQPCSLTLSTVTHCPCGGSSLEKLYLEAAVQPRESCLDPVPTCGEKCQKPLPCGPPSSPHLCPLPCHPGLCLPCPLTTLVRCRCGHMDRELPCAELTTRADDARCGKQCKAKRSCGRHKCGEQCCIMVEHSCPLLCGQLLSCTLHRCEELCHRGKCPRCPMVSFQELACSCGAAIIYPPVACGVRPPECSRICARAHPCDHPVSHKCHSEEACPPCTTLTVKTCYGGHEQVASHVTQLKLRFFLFREKTWLVTSRASRAAVTAGPGCRVDSTGVSRRATPGRAPPRAHSRAGSRGPVVTPVGLPVTRGWAVRTRPAPHR